MRQRAETELDLNDLAVVIQLFSYAGDYPVDRPCLEHLAEIVDKLEEDVLGAPTATVRGGRQVTVVFGEPVAVRPAARVKAEAPALTETFYRKVTELLAEAGRGAVGSPTGRLRPTSSRRPGSVSRPRP